MINYPYFMPQPTPHAEIGQVDSEQEAWNTAVPSGFTKIMFTRDDNTVFVKCMSVNGQVSMDIFDRRSEAKSAPSYVTREELEKALADIKEANK